MPGIVLQLLLHDETATKSISYPPEHRGTFWGSASPSEVMEPPGHFALSPALKQNLTRIAPKGDSMGDLHDSIKVVKRVISFNREIFVQRLRKENGVIYQNLHF